MVLIDVTQRLKKKYFVGVIARLLQTVCVIVGLCLCAYSNTKKKSSDTYGISFSILPANGGNIRRFKVTNTTLTTGVNSDDSNVRAQRDNECRFYLGESAIPRGGLGLYTVIDINKGQEAQSMPDICIYVADTPDGTAFHTHSWAKDVFIGSYEGKNPRAACEGFATLFNSMPDGEANVRTSTLISMHHHTNGGLHRDKEPGAGAITHYYGITSTAARDIPAGSEITINYGDWPYKKNVEYVAPTRAVTWIHKHAMCIDNIEIHTASNPSMGRGAFAKRFLPKDSLISPAPIQAFPSRKAFAQQVPEALFVNYCFEIPGTYPNNSDSILFFPYGPGVNLINHGGNTNANVKVEWSKHYMSHSSWLNLPEDQFWQMNYPGAIIMDIIALRDIEPGEELFLDYGPEWESAWKNHVTRWNKTHNTSSMKKKENYMYVEEIDRSKPFRTVEEQKTKPYGTNLHTVCHTPNWDRNEYTTMKWFEPEAPWPEGLTYCNLLSRTYNEKTKQYEYNVSLNFYRMEPDAIDKKNYIDTNVPQRAISFVDKPYQSDLHLPTAFRHPIGLPKAILPHHWIKV